MKSRVGLSRKRAKKEHFEKKKLLICRNIISRRRFETS